MKIGLYIVGGGSGSRLNKKKEISDYSAALGEEDDVSILMNCFAQMLPLVMKVTPIERRQSRFIRQCQRVK